MSFDMSEKQQPSEISEIIDKDDYVRVRGNSTDTTGQVKAINPQIVLLQPHIKQRPTGDSESVDQPQQVPIPGHTVERITEEYYNSFERTHIVNQYLDQPVHVQGQGHGTTGVLRSFYMNQMTFKPYLAFNTQKDRTLVEKSFTREYSEDMTIEPVPKPMLYPDTNIILSE